MNDNLPHGLMFHHFSEKSQPDALGSITPHRLDKIIASYRDSEFDILPAEEWYERASSDSLRSGQVCLTFDDALRSQFTLALPVLEKHRLTAFWFVYSSVFEGNGGTFETYRRFYNSYFPSFNSFFMVFIEYLTKANLHRGLAFEREEFIKSDYLKEYPFYSEVEREYRYFRDKVLGRKSFARLMDKMLVDYGVTHGEIAAQLWMTNDDLLDLVRDRHVVGLHSYSHPTSMSSLSFNDQLREYQKNAAHVRSITGRIVRTVAHPVNSYSRETLKILESIGITIGFRSNMHKVHYGSLEHPRNDCVNIQI